MMRSENNFQLSQLLYQIHWIIFLLLSQSTMPNIAYNLTYTIDEEVDGPVVIADLVADIRLVRFFTYEEIEKKTIAFFPTGQPASQYFEIKRSSRRSQSLLLRRRIDREAVCVSSESTSSSQVWSLSYFGYQVCRCTDKCFAVLKFVVKPLSTSNFVYFTARVIINDKNDHTPVFSPASFTVYFSEADPIGTAHQLPRATDPDFGANSVLHYELMSEKDLFEVRDTPDQHVLQLVLKGKLDRESKDHYSFFVVAKDMGHRPLAGTLSVTVLIRDDNDSPPVFSYPVYNATLVENSARGTTVVQLVATDKDRGVNQQIRYRFSEDSTESVRSLFRLNSRSGLITVEGNVDREVRDQYRFGVEARDNGPNSKTANAVVNVRITDLNDHAPNLKFARDEAGGEIGSGSGVASVRENRKPGTVVTTFSAHDPDLGRNGTVSCHVVQLDENFEVRRLVADEPSVFKLVTRVRFDREMSVKTTIKIVCSDSGNPIQKTEKTLTVLIADENDNAPTFNNGRFNEFHVEIQENNEIGRMLLHFNATDPDIGSNGMVRYRLVNESSSVGFSLNPSSGRLFLRKMLDRERTPSITVRVLAYDQGNPPLTSTATVQITVTDVNDCAPQLQHRYNLSVLENQEAGTIVDHLIITDPDFGKNGEVVLFGGDGDNFEVRRSGVIVTKRPLDREVMDEYSFVIYARDNALDRRKTSSSTVYVKVLDLNDMAPIFIYPQRDHMNFSVSYKEAVGFLIFKLVARDGDIGPNGRLSFRLEPASSFFRVDTENGLVLTASTFSTSDLGEHELHCVAQDHGGPHAMETMVTVNIHVVDKPPKGVKNLRRSAPENFIIMIVLGIFAGILICVLAVAIALVLRRKQGSGRGVCFRGHSSYRSDDKDTRSTDSNSTINMNRETVFGVATKPRRQTNGNIYSGSPTHVPLRGGVGDGELESMESVHGSHTDSGRGGSLDSTPCPMSTFITPNCGPGFRVSKDKLQMKKGNIDRLSTGTSSLLAPSCRRLPSPMGTSSNPQILHPYHTYQPLVHTPTATLRPACLHINCRGGTLPHVVHAGGSSGTLTLRRKPSSTCPVQPYDTLESVTGVETISPTVDCQLHSRESTLTRRLQHHQLHPQQHRCCREDQCDGESSSGLSDGPIIQQSAV